jgi:cardiolipin synthase
MLPAMLESWWAFVPVVETVWIVGISVWILFERRSPLATLAWIMGLSLLPVVGVPVYLMLGPRRFRRRKLRHAEAQDVAHRLGARAGEDLLDGAAEPGRSLMVMCERAVGRPALPRRAEVQLFTAGADLFTALVREIERARRHVHLEYYIWRPDGIGTRLRDALAARAGAGVEVRVLVDGFGSSRASDRFWRPLRRAGGEVERFNALSIGRWRPRLANFRTHRKIAVIDGTVGFTGGMNVTDGQTAEFSGAAAWRDTHLRLCGPAVRGLQMVFCEGWYYATSRALEDEAYFPPPGRRCAGEHPVQIIPSGPDEGNDAIHKLYVAAIGAATRRVLLTTAYLVPDDPLLTALATAALRGVDVRVLVPARSDLRIVAAASRSYYPDLLAAGIRLYQYERAMLHAKTLVVDDAVAVVGTANSDPRSFFLNFEVVAACYQAALCELLARCFEEDLASATEVTAATVERTGLGQRLLQNAARPLSPVL